MCWREDFWLVRLDLGLNLCVALINEVPDVDGREPASLWLRQPALPE